MSKVRVVSIGAVLMLCFPVAACDDEEPVTPTGGYQDGYQQGGQGTQPKFGGGVPVPQRFTVSGECYNGYPVQSDAAGNYYDYYGTPISRTATEYC